MSGITSRDLKCDLCHKKRHATGSIFCKKCMDKMLRWNRDKGCLEKIKSGDKRKYE